ncbi:MAG: glycosyltransferase family 1 protein [Clostridia bacterium]|nr:glycosyltransferase family 1 protein [Clostridia bacterium]
MNEPIKVLYFVDRMLRGGIQSLVIDWVSRFDKDKIHVDFLLLDDGKKYELEDTLKKIGCNVYKLSGIWVKNPIDFIREAKALDKFFKEHHDYKVVHMHSSSKNYMVLKYAKKYGIPVRIAHSHNIDFQTKNNIKKMYGKILKRKLLKYSTDYFACAEIAGEWLFGKKNVKNGKVKIIHNAVDYNKFEFNQNIRDKIRKEFNINQNEKLYGNVGRFSNQKNHIFLIDIFYEIHQLDKNTKLILVGEGEKKEEIKNKVKSLNLTKYVIFAGFRKDVNSIMQAMDVFLLPSLYEGLPVVGIEAQAAGLPVFTSKDVVTNELKIVENVEFISLEKSAKEWAEIIMNRDLIRKNTKNQLNKAGYFIENSVNELTNYYLK